MSGERTRTARSRIVIDAATVTLRLSAGDTLLWALARGWENSQLAGVALEAIFDSDGLRDVDYGETLDVTDEEAFYVEFDALAADLLLGTLPVEHPAHAPIVRGRSAAVAR